MNHPIYYTKYLDLTNSSKVDNIDSFLKFLDSLNSTEWNEFLLDLFTEKPFPTLIRRLRKDYSTVAYFALYINMLTPDTKSKIIKSTTYSFTKILEFENERKNDYIENCLNFSRLLKIGIAPNLLVDEIIMDLQLPDEVRYSAAATLVSYSDEVTENFWKHESLKLLRQNSFTFLAFPRFRYLNKIDPLDALASLEYAYLAKHVSLEDIKLTLEDYFFYISKKTNYHPEIARIFFRLPASLKKWIYQNVFVCDQLQILKTKLDKPIEQPVFADEVIDEIQSLNMEVMRMNVFPKEVNKLNQKVIRNIAIRTNPYKSFSTEEINAINPNFIRQTSIFNHVNRGKKYFKKSDFNTALNCYSKALVMFKETENKDDLTIYFYSWMLHEIGNIFFVMKHHEEAKRFYIQSFYIKKSLQAIPEIFLYATQLKMLAVSLENHPDSHDLEKMWQSFVSNLKKYRTEAPKQHHFFIDCLLGDAYYYMSKVSYQLAQSRNFDIYFKYSFKYAKKNNDLTGEIELMTLHSLFKNTDLYLSEIETILKSMSSSQRRNPYLSTLLINYSNSETQSIYHKLKEIFTKYIPFPDTKINYPLIKDFEKNVAFQNIH